VKNKKPGNKRIKRRRPEKSLNDAQLKGEIKQYHAQEYNRLSNSYSYVEVPITNRVK